MRRFDIGRCRDDADVLREYDAVNGSYVEFADVEPIIAERDQLRELLTMEREGRKVWSSEYHESRLRCEEVVAERDQLRAERDELTREVTFQREQRYAWEMQCYELQARVRELEGNLRRVMGESGEPPPWRKAGLPPNADANPARPDATGPHADVDGSE